METTKPVNYRNTHASERVDPKLVNRPFKVVKGKFVYASYKGGKWVW